MKDFQINIFYSKPDRGYIAEVPELLACSAFGDTAEQARAELNQAKKAWIQAAKRLGKPIPKPRS